MTRRKSRQPAKIHDHFDGSANCIECGGACKLEGDSLALTNVVRAYFEECVRTKRPVYPWMSHFLKDAGLDIAKHWARAKKAWEDTGIS